MNGRRFFWCWLIGATVASIAGNVAHALLAPTPNQIVAAAAAFIPPVVLCGAVHGVAILVRGRVAGWAYWCALCMTAALAACAFVLSFEALQDLAATYAGFSPAVAWLWPLAIDLSIANSTVALLALTVHRDAPVHIERTEQVENSIEYILEEPNQDGAEHLDTADQLIAAGVTKIARDKVAAVLCDVGAGTAPGTIARKHRVGYATVAKITTHAGAL